jgi:hypothetical protein
MNNPKPGTPEWDKAAEANHKRIRAAIGGNAEDGSPLTYAESRAYDALNNVHTPIAPAPNETLEQKLEREQREQALPLTVRVRRDLGVPHSDDRPLSAAEYAAWRKTQEWAGPQRMS